MVTHFSILAWRIPWTEKFGRLQSMGLQESDTTELTQHTTPDDQHTTGEGQGDDSEKAVAPHSSALAWKIPQTEEPGGLQSMGSLRVRHD